ncbi:hypothetical protein FRX31_024376, partial [Thalictrum thalictroides]
ALKKVSTLSKQIFSPKLFPRIAWHRTLDCILTIRGEEIGGRNQEDGKNRER